MYYDDYPMITEKYLKNLGITDINNLSNDFKEISINFLKDIILEFPENFPTFITQITEKEDDTYHNKLDDISDFKNLDVIPLERDREYNSFNIVFQDQDNDLRSVITYDELIIGMHRYYRYHEDIKRELIDLINEGFKNAREGGDE